MVLDIHPPICRLLSRQLSALSTVLTEGSTPGLSLKTLEFANVFVLHNKRQWLCQGYCGGNWEVSSDTHNASPVGASYMHSGVAAAM